MPSFVHDWDLLFPKEKRTPMGLKLIIGFWVLVVVTIVTLFVWQHVETGISDTKTQETTEAPQK